jgi:hypothetical protein
MSRRWIILVAALVGVALLRVVDPLAPKSPPALVNVTRAVKASPSVALATPSPSVQTSDAQSWPVRQRTENEPIDIFAPPAPPALPAPPPAPEPAAVAVLPPAPPPPPVAPPIPFTVIGSWTENGKTEVFLAGPQGTVLARAGDTLSGSYHVDSIGAAALQMTYLPLNQIQSLTWSASR